MESIIKFTVVKSENFHILTKIVTDKHVYYLNDFLKADGSKFKPRLVNTIYTKFFNGIDLKIPTFTTQEGGLLLYSDIYTERYEISDDILFNYLSSTNISTTTGKRVVIDRVYDILEDCKSNLNDYSGFDNYELATVPLPKCLEEPYSPNNHLKICKEDITFFNRTIPLRMLENVINSKFPILLDRKRVDAYASEVEIKLQQSLNFLYQKFNVSSIDWGRTNVPNNFVVLFVNYCRNAVSYSKHIKGRSVTLTKNHLLAYQKEFSAIPDLLSVVNGLLDYKEMSYSFSIIKSIVHTPMKTNDYYRFQPDLVDTNTYRIQTQDPNIQGWQPKLRSFIVPPRGYKLADIDIKGQDLHALFGLLHNQELRTLYEEMQDPYNAVLKYLGYELDKEKRDVAKVPILGITNGMSENTAMSRVPPHYASMIKQIFELITNDEGYRILKDNAYTIFNNYRPIKRGYIGLISSVDVDGKRDYSIKNSIINANFQLTSSEIFRLTIWAFYNHLYRGVIKLKDGTVLKPDDFVIGISIHDEYIFYYRDTISDEEAKSIIEFYTLPIIDNRKPMFGHIRVGLDHYEESK